MTGFGFGSRRGSVRRAWAAASVAAVALLAGNAVFADAWETESERFELKSRLEPRNGAVRIGEFQEWVLTLKKPDGSPVDTARLQVDGGMPGHGHGLPTQPQVTAYLGNGRFLIRGMRFNMLGDWVITFAIDLPEGRDTTAFLLRLDQWSREDKTVIESLRLRPDAEPPPSKSNRFADNPDAAALGKSLFFDTRFSINGDLSCASCHEPERYFTDGKARGEGVHRTGRNTPTVVGTAYQTWFYWDGRRDSLWSQALVPFEAPDEMGGSRMQVVRLVATDSAYRDAYERVFDSLPGTILESHLPAHAGPLGTTEMRNAWYRIPKGVRYDINAVYVNLGKALAAYQRSLTVPPSRFDLYVEALEDDGKNPNRYLTRAERAGLALWLDTEKTHCMRCHNGPRFTNDDFSNIGTGTFEGPNLDFGRVFGIRAAMTDEFNCQGEFSDAHPEECLHLEFLNRNAHVPLEGAFKVPSLRNVANTAPYMHDGRFPDLASVIEYYRNPPASGADHELVPLDLSNREARQLQAFLEALSAVEAERP